MHQHSQRSRKQQSERRIERNIEIISRKSTMEASNMKEITKLEERLEWNRKQKSKLGHEYGAGRSCLVCKEKCVGGLNLHFWRKICVNCKCPKEKHDLQPEDYDITRTFEILGVKTPKHSQHKQKIVEWTPPVASAAHESHSSERKIKKYFEALDDSLIPFANSEAALKRKELAEIQIPPHDFNPEKCDNLTDFETQQLQKYVDNVKKNALGQGEVDLFEQRPSVGHTAAVHDHDNNNVCAQLSGLSINACRGCGESISAAYVKAERLGQAAIYHPKCFKCKKCSQLLVDLIYFHHQNEIYCARDLAEIMEIPRCAACDELILVSEFTFADGKNYHIKHFCCLYCDKMLAGFQYVIDDKSNNPLCLPCYDKHFANYCGMCKMNIECNEQGVSIKDLHFHLKCFHCGNGACGKNLAGGRFCLRENIPFCSAACVRDGLP